MNELHFRNSRGMNTVLTAPPLFTGGVFCIGIPCRVRVEVRTRVWWLMLDVPEEAAEWTTP